MAEVRISSHVLWAARSCLSAKPSRATLGLRALPVRSFSSSQPTFANGDWTKPSSPTRLFDDRARAPPASRSSASAGVSFPPRPPPPSQTPSRLPSQSRGPSSQPYDAAKSPSMDISKILGEEIDDIARSYASNAPPRPDIRLRPSTGRTVHLKGGMDFGQAVMSVNRMVRKNNLFSMVRGQLFHERPGLKRKRLRSERWRARFKKGFVATVKRVQELTKQGW